MQTISQILQNALASSTKTASASVPTVAPEAEIADLVFGSPKEAETANEQPKVASKEEPSVLSTAAYGLKLARALDQAADLVKEASLTVTATPIPGNTTLPAASNNSVPAKYDVPGQRVTGREMPTSENDPVSSLGPPPGGKSASLRLASAKLADAEVLERYGQKESAAALRKEASSLQKRAEMEDGPTASGNPAMPTMATSMTGGGEGPSMSNEKMINITRAEARNPTTAEMRKVISETPKVDPIVAATVGSSEGVKASHAIRDYVKKAQALIADPNAPAAARNKAASVMGSFTGKAG